MSSGAFSRSALSWPFKWSGKFRPVDQEFDKRDSAACPTSGWRGEAVGNLWVNGTCPLDWPLCFRDDVIAESLLWAIR